LSREAKGLDKRPFDLNWIQAHDDIIEVERVRKCKKIEMREILERAQTLFKLCFPNMNSKLHEMSTKYYVVYLLRQLHINYIFNYLIVVLSNSVKTKFGYNSTEIHTRLNTELTDTNKLHELHCKNSITCTSKIYSNNDAPSVFKLYNTGQRNQRIEYLTISACILF
jgi:hypothetical protein